VLPYLDFRLFFRPGFLLATSSSLAILCSLGFARSIARMIFLSVLDIHSSSHWDTSDATIDEPGLGASGFATMGSGRRVDATTGRFRATRRRRD
jgi:hypothetical protein